MTTSEPYRVSLKFGPTIRQLPRDPEADRRTLRAIHDHALRGDMARAIAESRVALQRGLEHPMLLNFDAAGLENEGNLEAAQVRLRRALEIAPNDLGARMALGIGCLRLERFEEAADCFEAVVRARPDQAAAHANLGAALSGLARLAEAQAAYQQALTLQPGHLAAQAGLAALASRRGDHDTARGLAQAVLAREPNHPDSVLSLAAADLAQGRPHAAEQALRALLSDPRPTQTDRALAEGQLGDVLDAMDRVDEAFDAYAACNHRLSVAYAPQFAALASPADLAAGFAEVFEAGAALPAEAGDAGGEPQLVFLLGFPRSGTTLLEAVLRGHAEVETLEERETLIDGTRAFLSDVAGLKRLLSAEEADLAPLREAYWRRAREAGAQLDRRIFVDKHPFNTVKLPLIARLFPKAKLLFAQRDPRDVVLSCFRRRFRISHHTYALLDLTRAARFYSETMRLEQALAPALASQVRVIRHERLVADFDTEARGTCDFLGLPWRAEMADIGRRAREGAIATPSAAQLSRGLSTEGVGQWRRYAAQLQPIAPILAPWVERFGYND